LPASSIVYTITNPTSEDVFCLAYGAVIPANSTVVCTLAQYNNVNTNGVWTVATTTTALLPVITSITGTPAHGTAGPITITGCNFTGCTGVKIGPNAATSVVVVSDTQITCTTPTELAALHYAVVVTTPSGANVADLTFT
jgi:putative cell wall-binding protein